MDHRIGIVGGGITGLALLHELRRRGSDAVLFEAEPEPGGVIRSRQAEGKVLDLGPQRTRRIPAMARLIEELGLADETLAAPAGLPLFVWREGRLRLVPRSPGELARTPLLSAPAKLRVLLEPLTGSPRAEDTVADLFIRAFGLEAYRSFLGPLFGGIYGSDPARMRVRHALADLLSQFGVRRSLLLAFLRRWRTGAAAPAAISFRDGMQALPRALAAAHADRVHLGSPVHSISRRGGGGSEGWRLETAGGPVGVETAVLTVPAGAAAALLGPAAPNAAKRLERLVYNPLAVVHLHAETELVGYGYQVAFGEELRTRGVTWNASLFGRDGVYTAYLGGARDPEVVERSDAELGELAAQEFAVVTGHAARALRVSRTRIPAFDLSWDGLDGLAPPPGVRLCASYLSRPGITGRLAGARSLAAELSST